MSALYQAFQLKDITLRNRIAVPPMCQYQAIDGLVNDWHHVHYAGLGRGGAGLVIVEASAVSPEGRITPGCAGIWSDAHTAALAPIAAAIKAGGAVPGIQIAHAGRKASANRPWEGDDHIPAGDPRGWETIAPSALPFGAQLPKVPRAMTLDDIARVRQDFADAAQRALDAGFEWLELHFAHGYLGQSFFSAHSNQRQDEYGGSAANRHRFLIETLAAVRHVWPEHLPLTARFGVIEYDGQDAQTVADAIDLTLSLKRTGLDLLSVSVGFTIPGAQVPWKTPGFLAPIAERVRRETGLPVSSAWGMDDPSLAEQLIATQQLDLVQIGKGHLANPHWSYAAARALKQEQAASLLPPSYGHWLQRY